VLRERNTDRFVAAQRRAVIREFGVLLQQDTGEGLGHVQHGRHVDPDVCHAEVVLRRHSPVDDRLARRSSGNDAVTIHRPFIVREIASMSMRRRRLHGCLMHVVDPETGSCGVGDIVQVAGRDIQYQF